MILCKVYPIFVLPKQLSGGQKSRKMKKLTKKAAKQIIIAKVVRPGVVNYSFSNQGCRNAGLNQEQYHIAMEAWQNARLDSGKSSIVDDIVRAVNMMK